MSVCVTLLEGTVPISLSTQTRYTLLTITAAFSFVSGLKGIMTKGLDAADVREQELEHLIQDTKRFPKLLRGLKPRNVEENRKLQENTISRFVVSSNWIDLQN